MDGKRLEITEDILDRVVYGMENQKERLFLVPADGALRSADGSGAVPAGGIPMPPWGPADGFRLMDAFVGTLSDDVLRSRLRYILHSGSGVFRRFKDALKELPEMEGLWRRYKKREMRRVALSWLSRWSDALALEALEAADPEQEEWDDLALTDFVFRPGRPGDETAVAGWMGSAEIETYPALDTGDRERFALRMKVEKLSYGDLAIAEDPSGDVVGFSWFSLSDPETGSCSPRGLIRQVYVRPGYRGLGIGRRLAAMAVDALFERGTGSLIAAAGGENPLERFLESQGFEPAAVVWLKKD